MEVQIRDLRDSVSAMAGVIGIILSEMPDKERSLAAGRIIQAHSKALSEWDEGGPAPSGVFVSVLSTYVDRLLSEKTDDGG